MQPRLVIHAGRHKTGTTAIQKFLYDNAPALARQGVVYPDVGLDGVAHHQLAWAYGEGQSGRMRETDKSIWAEIAGKCSDNTRCVIVSSESLYRPLIDTNNAREIMDMLPGFDIEILVYVRNQLDFVESSYAQRVKAGHIVPSVSEWVTSSGVDYEQQISGIAAGFGESNIKVRVYDRAVFEGGSIFTDFISACGLDWDESFDIPQDKVNTSLTPKALSICKRSNEIHSEEAIADRRKFNLFIRDLVADTLEDEPAASLMSGWQRKKLMSRCKKSNAKLVQRFGADEALVNAKPVNKQYVDISRQIVSTDELVGLLYAAWKMTNKK